MKPRRGEAQEQLAFLATLRDAITDEADPVRVLRATAALVAQRFATLCIVDVTNPSRPVEASAIHRIEIAHADLSRATSLAVLAKQFGAKPGGRVARALFAGEAEILARVPAAQAALELVPGYVATSVLRLPVFAAGSSWALMTWVSCDARMHYSTGDFAFAREVVGWCGLAAEAARARKAPPRASYAPGAISAAKGEAPRPARTRG